MDRGTDAAAVLRNEALPLRLGHIGVVNRSQHDLNTGTAMAAARAAEEAFFASRPEYQDVRRAYSTMPATLVSCLPVA
jgi:dynamin 1-like protein